MFLAAGVFAFISDPRHVFSILGEVRLATQTANWVGRRLSAGRYEVKRQLGEGGMGFVYLASDRNLDTDVVIKVPRRAMLEDAEFAGRFAREIRSLVKLEHPHIVKVMDAGEEDGLPFAVMQFLAGGSLRDRCPLGEPARQSLHELLSWLPTIGDALDFIHSKGYIHRDIKPDNILFSGHGHAFLSDFGVAKVLAEGVQKNRQTVMTAAGMVLGTPQYMAPELIMGQAYDGRIDQYALAIIVYEIVSGQFPFDDPNPTAIFVQQTTRPAPRLNETLPSVPKRLSAAVYRGMSKDPSRRFSDCMAFANEILQSIDSADQAVEPSRPSASPAAIKTPTTKAGVSVACPNCQRTLRLSVDAVGKLIRCPACQQKFHAPDMGAARPAGDGERLATVVETPPTGKQRLQTVRESSGLETADEHSAGFRAGRRTFAIAASLVVLLCAGTVGLLLTLGRGHHPEPATRPDRETASADLAKVLPKPADTSTKDVPKTPSESGDFAGKDKPSAPPPLRGSNMNAPPKETPEERPSFPLEKGPDFSTPPPERGLPRVPRPNPPGRAGGAPEASNASLLPSDKWSDLFASEQNFRDHWRLGRTNAQFDQKWKKISVTTSSNMGTIEVNQPWKEFQLSIWPDLRKFPARQHPYIDVDVHINGAEFPLSLPRTSSPTTLVFTNDNGRVSVQANSGRSTRGRKEADRTVNDRLVCRFTAIKRDIEIVLSNIKVRPK
jgi:serine/threonine-protein kinase